MNNPDSLEKAIEFITGRMAEMESQAFQQEEFSDLSMRQVLYLETILHLEHPSFGELAEALKITRPSVTAQVARLIQNGYVRKVQDDQDRRSFHILPTQKAVDFARLHQALHRQIARALTVRLDEGEILDLARLLQKAIGNT